MAMQLFFFATGPINSWQCGPMSSFIDEMSLPAQGGRRIEAPQTFADKINGWKQLEKKSNGQ